MEHLYSHSGGWNVEKEVRKCSLAMCPEKKENTHKPVRTNGHGHRQKCSTRLCVSLSA